MHHSFSCPGTGLSQCSRSKMVYSLISFFITLTQNTHAIKDHVVTGYIFVPGIGLNAFVQYNTRFTSGRGCIGRTSTNGNSHTGLLQVCNSVATNETIAAEDQYFQILLQALFVQTLVIGNNNWFLSMAGSLIFHTDRYSAHLLDPRHAELLHHYYMENADHLTPWEPQREPGYHALPNWQARTKIWAEEQRAGTALRVLAIADEELIGICSFTNISAGVFQACNLGYSIADRHGGQGLMTEIVQHSVAYVFTELNLHRVMANYMPENLASAHILTKLGFEREGFARSYLKINGQWRDHVLTAKINPAHLD